MVSPFNSLTSNSILFGKLLSKRKHLFDFCFGESVFRRNGNFSRRLGAKLLSTNGQNTISIQRERHFNFGLSTWHHWDVLQLKFSKKAIIPNLMTFSFINFDSHFCLIISIGRKRFLLFSGDC
mmetsp:Transcript_37281/g.51485  ORF Transcript_37281/g.51485 Transcript_37281/m.51485 type:complete len:123 (-) Transcript_37281:1308-1676(-)